MKRSLIFFELLQKFGAKVIPTMHWTGLKDLRRWAEWINNNAVYAIAIDLQMLTSAWLWRQTIEQLKIFMTMLKKPMHFVVTGPSTPRRIGQIHSALKSVSIVSALPTQTAINHRRLKLTLNDKIFREPSALASDRLMVLNNQLLQRICKRPVGQTSLLLPVH